MMEIPGEKKAGPTRPSPDRVAESLARLTIRQPAQPKPPEATASLRRLDNIASTAETGTIEQDPELLMKKEVLDFFTEQQPSASIFEILRCIYNLSSRERLPDIEFRRVQVALDTLQEEGAVIHAGHGYFMTRMYYDECVEPELAKSVLEIVRSISPQAIGFLGLFKKANLHQGHNHVSGARLAATLHKMVKAEIIKKVELPPGKDGNTHSGYVLAEDDMDSKTDIEANPETEPGTTIGQQDTVSRSGAPPEVVLPTTQEKPAAYLKRIGRKNNLGKETFTQ